MKYLMSLFISFLFVGTAIWSDNSTDEKEIKLVVEKAMEAIYNSGNLKIFDELIHEEYILWIKNGNELLKLTKQKQREFLGHYKDAGLFPNYFGVPVSVRFKHIEISGHAAMVIQDFYKGDVHTCYDHIALYKFEDGWKIISWTTYTDKEAQK